MNTSRTIEAPPRSNSRAKRKLAVLTSTHGGNFAPQGGERRSVKLWTSRDSDVSRSKSRENRRYEDSHMSSDHDMDDVSEHCQERTTSHLKLFKDFLNQTEVT